MGAKIYLIYFIFITFKNFSCLAFYNQNFLLPAGNNFNGLIDISQKFSENVCVEQSNKIIEAFRQLMPTGFTKGDLDIPPLAPYEIFHLDVDNITHELGYVYGTLDNIVVTNLDQFKVLNIECNPTIGKINVSVITDEVTVTGDYDLKGEALDLLPMFGNGPFNIKLYNLNVDIKIQFSIIQMNLKELHINTSISKSDIYLHNFMGGGENEKLFNEVLSEIGPDSIHDLWPDIEPTFVKIIKNKINAAIFSKTIDNLLNVFNPAKYGSTFGSDLIKNFIQK